MRETLRWSLWTTAIAVLGLPGCKVGSGFQLGQEAQIDFSPSVVAFGDVPRGEQASRVITLRHVGSGGEIRVDPVRMVTDSPDLTIGYVEGSSLVPGEELRIQIVYTSGHDERDEGDLVVGLNLAATQELRIPVSTPGQRGQLVASPSALDFGITQAGSPGTISVVLYNAGTAPTTLTGFEVFGDEDGDFSATIPAGAVIAPSATVLVSTHYAPSNQNKDEGVLRILTERDDVFTDVPLEGEEETPVLVLEPSIVQFGWVEPGGTKLVTLKMRNEGNTHVDITSLQLMDAEAGVGIVSPPEPNRSTGVVRIEPGGVVKFGAIFQPVDEVPMTGAPIARLVVESTDEAHNPLEVPFHGAAGVPNLYISPEDVVDFSFVAEGFVAKRAVTIVNVGDEATSVDAANLVNPTSSEFAFTNPGDLPANLNPGESVVLEITFENTGGDEGTEFANFILNTSDDLIPEYPLDVVARRAERPTCEPAFVPDFLSMGPHRAGTSDSATMHAVNYGSGNCEYREWDLIGCSKVQMGVRHRFKCDANYPDSPFNVISAPVYGEILGPGEILTFEVQFNAPEIYNEKLGRDQYFGRLAVFFHDPNLKTFKYLAPAGGWMKGVNLQAESALPIVSVEPGDLSFGLVRKDCESAAGLVTISNLGPMEAEVSDIALQGCTGDVVIKNLPELPYVLSGFEALYLEVAFLPSTGGPQACTLKVITDSLNKPEAETTLSGSGVDVTHNVDLYEQIPAPKVDVLFVVDDSGSMADEQQMLKQELPKLVDIAVEWGQDYHLAVTTTDTSLQVGKFKGYPPIVTPSEDPAIFAQHLIVGTAGHWKEMGLEGAWMALSGPTVASTEIECINKPNACPSGLWCIEGYCRGQNWGFLRDDAELVIIIVSDEEDSSPESPDWYVSQFTALKPTQTGVGVKLHAVVMTLDGCPGGKWGTPGLRYVQAVEMFGGEVVSICATDFSGEFDAIGSKTFGLKDTFYPSLPPDPATLEVSVDGVLCEDGWTWNDATQSVLFETGAACFPEYDQQVTLEYEVACFLGTN